jgi:hypothetical protein
MPSWSGVLNELLEGPQPPQLDAVRRKYLDALHRHTGRTTILYATRFLQANETPPNLLSIVPEDLQGLMEVIHGTKGPNLDLILHSTGVRVHEGRMNSVVGA